MSESTVIAGDARIAEAERQPGLFPPAGRPERARSWIWTTEP